LDDSRQWEAVAREKNIKITDNLIDRRNSVDTPILSGGNPRDRVKIYAVNGERAIFADPMFKDPGNQEFSLRRGSPAAARHVAAGAYTPGESSELWWERRFPPSLVCVPSSTTFKTLASSRNRYAISSSSRATSPITF